jgi:hypothetical protein
MSQDNRDFEEIYRSLTPGLVVAACTAKSLVALRSFCFSLKAAAIRCGSDVMLYSGTEVPTDWDAVGIQTQEHGARGVRVFVINRFADTSTAGIVGRLHREPGFDTGNGSIDPKIAGSLQEGALGSKITLLVTTLAGKEGQIRDRRIARLTSREEGVFIAIEHERFRDDYYSVWVTSGATEKSYGVDFISECPQAPKTPAQPESAAARAKVRVDGPSPPRPSWFRRLFS